MAWLSHHGGEVKNPKSDLVAELSSLGAGGKYPANVERDMHRKLRRACRSVRAKIQLKKVRLTNPSTGVVGWEDFPILLPEELCKAFWKLGEDTFRKCLFGGMSEQEVASYWQHMEAVSPWFQSHPARSWHCKGKLAAIAPYGDEVQCYRNSECGVISVTAWSADFAWKAHPLNRYYTIALWSEHHESLHTYNDVMHHFVESFKRLTSPTAIWPWSQKGYSFVMTGVQGDLKWLCERYNVHNYRRNDFCSRCKVVKDDHDTYKTITNFSGQETAFELRDYSGQDLSQLFGPLFGMPGMRIECCMHDIMHSQYLGTGKALNGRVFLKKSKKNI